MKWGCIGIRSAIPRSQVNGTLRVFNNQGRYLTQVVEGEVAYGWGSNVPFRIRR